MVHSICQMNNMLIRWQAGVDASGTCAAAGLPGCLLVHIPTSKACFARNHLQGAQGAQHLPVQDAGGAEGLWRIHRGAVYY